MLDFKSTQTFMLEYGNKTFDEFPFCDGDAFLLCEIFYMPFEDVVSSSFDDEPVDFKKAATDLFNLRGAKHKGNGVAIFSHQPSRNMLRMASMKRWQGMKIAAIEKKFTKSPAVSICIGTFIMPDGKVVVNYRGTDDTIAGWKEDFDIFITNGTPSHPISRDYLDKAGETYDGDIIVIGHSKGGNMALYAAMNCKEEVRNRIISLYNNDGPGFYDHSFISGNAYQSLKPVYHHYIPKTDIVGTCMANDYDSKVVKTFVRFPLFQHYIGMWQLKDGEAVTIDGTSYICKIYDIWNSRICAKVEREGYSDVVETVFDRVSVGFGYDTLTEFVQHPVSAIKNGAEAWKEIDPEVREKFIDVFDGGFSHIKGTIKNLKNVDVQKLTESFFRGENLQ